MSNEWREQPERGNTLALSTICWIATHMGRPAARCLLYPITLYFLLTAGHARRSSKRFLRQAGLEKVDLRHVFRHLHTFSAVILDRVFFMRGDLEQFDIRLHFDPGVREHLSGNQGALLMGAHLGSFDALRALGLQHREVRLRVLMEHGHNELITRMLEALNPQFAETVIPLGRLDTLLRTREWVDQGGTVALLGDRMLAADSESRERAITCNFLGERAPFPTGPIKLAGLLEVPIMLFFGIYRGGRTYDVYLEWFADGEIPAVNKDTEAMAAHVQKYADRLEEVARSAPYNWFNFYAFWEANHGATHA